MKKFGPICAFLVVFLVLGTALSVVQSQMNAIRYTQHLTDVDPLDNAPPWVAFTSVALGGFRGLVADWLWLRSSKMQDEGNYFEMVQLAEWIVKLQPRFTSAHSFLGWNMAYNISVTFTNFDDRWRWVKRGMELIRDEALEYNPGDPELFRQLGWIFQHKMGQEYDDANRYYKTEFAKEMIRLFSDYYGQWELLAKAPDNEQKLRAALGGKNDFWDIIAKYGYPNFTDFERHFREIAIIPTSSYEGQPPIKEELDKLGITETVESCLRARWMKQKYRLEPVRMIHLNEVYGELDWRLSEAHAIYWAERGKEKWSSEKDTMRRLNCDRMIFQSLCQAFDAGRLIYLKDIGHLEMTSNIKVVDVTNKIYQDLLEYYNRQSSVLGSYGGFLDNAIATLYKFGEKKKANEYLQIARSIKEFSPRFNLDLDEFVLRELAERMKGATNAQAQNTIQSYIMNAYYQLAIDEEEPANTFITIAKQLYDRYMKDNEGIEQRKGLPPFEQMKKTTLEMTKQRINPAIAKRLEELLPHSGEKFIPEAGEIAAPEVK